MDFKKTAKRRGRNAPALDFKKKTKTNTKTEIKTKKKKRKKTKNFQHPQAFISNRARGFIRPPKCLGDLIG